MNGELLDVRHGEGLGRGKLKRYVERHEHVQQIEFSKRRKWTKLLKQR